MKLEFNPQKIQNPYQAFKTLESKVTKCTKNSEKIDYSSFYAALAEIGDTFERQNQIHVMNKNAKRLAETLVNLKNSNLAGIIYSFLIKINENNTKLVEEFALNGLAIAKRFNDPVHIMARCENLRRIYTVKQPDSEKLLKILYMEKRALTDICKKYESSKNRFQSISRKVKPIDNYAQMLGKIKIQIAKMIKDKDSTSAIQELQDARNLLKSCTEKNYDNIITNLLNNIKN